MLRLTLFILVAVAIFTSCFKDPKPELKPMPLAVIDTAEFINRQKNADAVVMATIESIDEMPEYSAPCGILARIAFSCPTQKYRAKLRLVNGRAMHIMYEIPYDGYQPLTKGQYAVFFLHKRFFTRCNGASSYSYCTIDEWLSLNSPLDVVAVQ